LRTREELLLKHIKNKNVLDLGNSWGDFKELIQLHASSYKGLDIEKGAYYQKDLNKKFDLKKKFDVIVAGEFIEHLENTGTFLKNVGRHLKKNGVFFLTTPNPTSSRFFIYGLMDREPEFGGHLNYFTKDALHLLLSQHFSKVKVGFTNNTTNIKNKDRASWKLNFHTECFIGDIIPRPSPHIYAICRKK